MRLSYKKFAGKLCLVIGVSLLTFSILGTTTNLGDYPNPEPETWDRVDEELVKATPDLVSLKNAAHGSISNEYSEQEKMMRLYDLVSLRMTHSDKAKYNLFSNWLMWLGGHVYSPLAFIRDPDILLQKGRSALCSAQSYLLQVLAEDIGIRTRHVGLNGHVVMEAWYQDDWHMFDPNLEIVPITGTGHILSTEQFSSSPQLVQVFYQQRGDISYTSKLVKIFTSREDNSFRLFWMINKEVLYRFEIIASIFKWLFPIVLIVIGLFTINSRDGKECVE